MNNIIEISIKFKIVWNKLKRKIDVLQSATSWNPKLMRLLEWNCEK